MPERPTVASLGEDELLGLVFPVLPTGSATLLGPGDDAAVVAAPDGRVVISTDVLVEGRHFRRDWSDAHDVGWKAAVQNLADVAAMGARPTSLVVALVIPASTEVAWVVDLARGLAGACAPHDVGVVGGDLSGGDQVVVAVTVHGDLGGRAPVLRSGARPGDVVVHAGSIGRSAAGYAVLLAGRGVPTDERFAGPLQAHRRPVCPLGMGPAVALAGATAMLDVSDGLLRDGARLARASGVVLDLSTEALGPDLAALADVAAAVGADPMAWVLGGGEDHGLLATLPAAAPLPDGFRAVGTVADGEPGVLVDGRAWEGPTGWDHFAG